jgi:hypothetical protein
LLPIPTKAAIGTHNWERDVNQRLREWTNDPSQIADDGLDPPKAEIIQKAAQLAERLQALGAPAPDSLTPDPNGGIVFSWHETDVLEEYHIWDDGSVEYRKFHGTRLMDRRALGE